MSVRTICITTAACLTFTPACFAQGTVANPITVPGPVGVRPLPDPDPPAPDPADNIRPANRDKAGATREGYGYEQIFIDRPSETFPTTRTDGEPTDTSAGNTTIASEPAPHPDPDGDRPIATNDLLTFVDDFFTHRPAADVNGDGRVDTADLLAFLDTFFNIDNVPPG